MLEHRFKVAELCILFKHKIKNKDIILKALDNVYTKDFGIDIFNNWDKLEIAFIANDYWPEGSLIKKYIRMNELEILFDCVDNLLKLKSKKQAKKVIRTYYKGLDDIDIKYALEDWEDTKQYLRSSDGLPEYL